MVYQTQRFNWFNHFVILLKHLVITSKHHVNTLLSLPIPWNQWCTTWNFARSRHIWDISRRSWSTKTNTPRHFFKKLNTQPIHHNIFVQNFTHRRDITEKFHRKTGDIWFIQYIFEKCRDNKVCILQNFGELIPN